MKKKVDPRIQVVVTTAAKMKDRTINKIMIMMVVLVKVPLIDQITREVVDIPTQEKEVMDHILPEAVELDTFLVVKYNG
jgi:hypothetical protein